MAEIDRYLRMMAEHGASDLHLCTNSKPIFRKDGSLMRLREDEVDGQRVKTILYEILPQRNEQEFNTTHDTDFAYELADCGRFRVNYYVDRKGMCGSFRLIPSAIQTMEQLRLPKSIEKFCSLGKGLVLVTGPTGSGKSTTLAAIIDHINKARSDHILTIEDPIEFVHPNQRCLVNQRQVHLHTDSFKSALRAALREDPDIVLVGEMRDLETTRIALETAETGHLVFGTLHTSTAISTIDRLIEQFPADEQQQIRMMLSSSLKGIIAQNLLKRKGGGRVAAIEVLVVNAAVSSLIREAKVSQIMSIMQTAKKEGMAILNQELARLVKEDLVEPEEAWRTAVDRGDLMKQYESAGISFTPPEE